MTPFIYLTRPELHTVSGGLRSFSDPASATTGARSSPCLRCHCCRYLVKNGDIIWLQDVFKHELEILLSHAKAFVFVSLVEGFGIPPLEAMSCSVPVVSSDISVHRWVQGDAPLYCNPYDCQDIAKSIEAVCDPEKDNLRVQ